MNFWELFARQNDRKAYTLCSVRMLRDVSLHEELTYDKVATAAKRPPYARLRAAPAPAPAADATTTTSTQTVTTPTTTTSTQTVSVSPDDTVSPSPLLVGELVDVIIPRVGGSATRTMSGKVVRVAEGLFDVQFRDGSTSKGLDECLLVRTFTPTKAFLPNPARKGRKKRMKSVNFHESMVLKQEDKKLVRDFRKAHKKITDADVRKPWDPTGVHVQVRR